MLPLGVLTVAVAMVNASSRAKLLNPHRRSAQRTHESPLTVLQMVMCTAKDADWRQLHRNSWIADAQKLHFSPYSFHDGGPPARLVWDYRFVIGLMDGIASSVRQQVLSENKTFGDIVELGLEENMDNGKTHAAFSWAHRHYMSPTARSKGGVPGADYVAKTDLDTYLNWER